MKTINSFRSKLLALTLALMASMSSFAYDFKDGYLFYNILSDGTVAVTSEIYGMPYDYLPISLVIPSEVTGYNGETYIVTEIANYALSGCDMLESCVIPNTVKKIGVYAFTGCSKLVDISFPESLEDVLGGALYECAWYNNQPDGLVYVGNLLYRYKGIAPVGTIEVREGTKAILDFAFTQQPNIQSVVLPNSVTSVHVRAFADCPNLETVVLPNSLSVIEDETFSNCPKLSSIDLPQNVSIIGANAFRACSSLSHIEWPQQLTNIGANAFYECTQLDNVDAIPASIQKIGAKAFYNTAWEQRQPAGYIYIHNVFYAYTGELTENLHINIKPGTTYISGGAVSRCIVVNGRYSENIVRKLTIPTTVTEIEDETFRYCRNLDTIICTSVKPPLISENTFNLTLQKNKHVLLVPTKALDIYSWWGLLPYEAAPYWNNFANVKPITDPYVYDPMYFEKDSIQYHITNDTLAPYEVEVTHWYGLEQWDMERHNYPELTTADIPASVTYKGTTYLVTRIGKMAFYHASQLQRVTIGENVKTIDEQAFSVCRNLSHVVIGENVDSILLSAFASGNSKIKVLDIPKNVKYIDHESLSAYSLEAINVHPDNANYTSVDGVLFNKQKNYLQEFPRSKATTYMVPDCVDTIGRSAFASNHNIVLISFSPNSQLKHIEKEAFWGCLLMQRLDLPASLQSIEERAFNGCSSLESITSTNITPPVMSAWYSYNEQVFGSVPYDIPLFVPAESVERYDAAPQWDRFATVMPIGSINMNDFPMLAGLQRTVCNEYCGETEDDNSANNTYKQTFDNIFFENDKPYIFCKGYLLREEENKILVYSQILNKDLVLYDFTLEVGDSLPALYIDYQQHNTMDWMPYDSGVVDYNIDPDGTIYPADTFIVTNISTVTLLDGKEYKKWTFNNGMEYVEGIGMYGGRRNGNFFGLIQEVVVPCHTDEHLVCASKNNKLLYQMDDAEMERLGTECLCDYNSGPKKDNAKNGKIGGRPTPTQWNMLEFDTKEVDGTPTITRAETFSYTLENDSIVANKKTFYQLARQSTKDTAVTKSFVGALHFGEDEDNRVYFLRDGVEYVLYDFTAEPGDTLEIFAGIDNYPQYTTYTHVVTDKDTLGNGACIMFLEVVFPEESASVENAQKVWLAGLGSVDGIVHNTATRTSDAYEAPSRSARSSETQTSVMLCAWRYDDCLYTTNHSDYDTFGCVYNIDEMTAIEDTHGSSSTTDYQKLLRDGQLLIIHKGKTYNVLGVAVE